MAAGMVWTLCYEDRTISAKETHDAQASDSLHMLYPSPLSSPVPSPSPLTLPRRTQVAQLQADWEFIKTSYLAHFGSHVLRNNDTGRPVFLQFGPITLKEPSDWTKMLADVFQDAAKRPHLLGTDLVSDPPHAPATALMLRF